MREYKIVNDTIENGNNLYEIIVDRGMSGEDIFNLFTNWHGMQLVTRAMCENLRDCEGFDEFEDDEDDEDLIEESIKVEVQYELNRAWIYDDNDETIGETNFVVPGNWLINFFNDNRKDKYWFIKDFEEFLDMYEPEEDGELIYQAAMKDEVLIEDIGVVIY